MGEPPIFSCKAHVFTIDPKTKKTWLPASNQAIKVSFFFDKSRDSYRILSMDESAADASRKMTINSVVSEKMSFKKTSQKFGQWADPSSNAVYGLGFGNETELDRFVEQFCQALDHTRRLRRNVQQQQQQQFAVPSYSQDQGGPDQQPQQFMNSAGDQLGVDLDSSIVADKEKLMQMNIIVQKLEAENMALRNAAAASGRYPEQDSRTLQLEKENAMLKNKIKQLSDTVSHQEQLLKDAPSVANELKQKLLEASELSSQLVNVMLTAPAQRKY